MTKTHLTSIQDRIGELGLDLHAPEINEAVKAQELRRPTTEAKRRKEAIKTNLIVGLVVGVLVALCMQSTVNAEVSKGVKAASLSPAVAATATTTPGATSGK